MDFGSNEKAVDNSVPSSISLFVALYLILLAFFIILTKDLSFDEYRQTVALHSIYKTFGRPKTQEIFFGVIDESKVVSFHSEIEEIFKKEAQITISVNSSKFEIELDKSYLYYADEVNFKPEILDKIIQLKDVIRRWNLKSDPNFTIGLTQTNYAVDKQRLDYFRTKFGKVNFRTGLNIDEKQKLTLIVENKVGER